MKFKTLSNKDFEKPCITSEIKSIIIKRKKIISDFAVKIKSLRIYILISEILSMAKLDSPKGIIMNINSML